MAGTLPSSSTSCPSADHLGWASLPLDVLSEILNKLSEYVDHVRVAAVCKGWRSIAKDYNNSTQCRWRRVLPPMLMFPEYSKGESRNIHSRTRMRGVLYGVSEGKTYENVQLPLPRLISRMKTKRHFFGCGHGWLAQVEHLPQCHITLLNPFRKFESVSLPPLDIDGSFVPQDVKNIKVVLSAVPNLNRDNYVVVAFSMYEKTQIAFFKGGQKNWTYTFMPYRFIDAIFYKGDLYAVECSGITLRVSIFNVQSIFDKKGPRWKKPMARPTIETPRFSRFGYLVESTKGNLFYIQKTWRPEKGWIPRNNKMPPAKVMFRVYKLAFSIDGGQLTAEAVEVTSTDDEVLFVGDNQTSVSVLASGFPGCQRNCIYYADAVLNFKAGPYRRYAVVPCDMGIFNLDEKKTIMEYNRKKHRWMPYILWLTPPVQGLLRDSDS